MNLSKVRLEKTEIAGHFEKRNHFQKLHTSILDAESGFAIANAQIKKCEAEADRQLQAERKRIINEVIKLSKWKQKHYDPSANVGTPDSTGGVITLGEEYYVIPVNKVQALKAKKEVK